MKKLVVCMSVLMTAFSVIAATNVSSVNIVGYNKLNVEPSGGFVLVAPAFDPMQTNQLTLKGLFGTNSLVQSSFPGAADKVYLWSTASNKWNQFFQKVNGEFYDAGIPPWIVATNPTVDVGEGFFIQGASATTNTITMLGEVVTAGTQQTDIVTGFQTLGYPFSADVMLENTAFSNNATKSAFPGAADKVYIFENGQYVQVFLKTDNKWYRADMPPWTTPTNVNIRIGQGFWYEAINAFTNKEPNPYLHNL